MLKEIDELAKTNGKDLFKKLENELISRQLQWSHVAKKMGCSRGNLSNLLSNLRNGKISLYHLTAICYVLDIKVADLFNGKGRGGDMAQLVDSSVQRLNTGDVVKLKDILAPVWQTFTNQQKRNIGKSFYRDVLEGFYPRIVFLKKGSDNQARYKISSKT